jgi:hypothetical protein
MKTVPDSLGASRSYPKTKLAAPLRIVLGALMPAGAFVASESPRAAKRATLPLVLPVRVQVALPTPAGTIKKSLEAPFASAGVVPEPQPPRVSISFGKKPSASSPTTPPVPEATAGRSTKPRVTLRSPTPASARYSRLVLASDPGAVRYAVYTCAPSGLAAGEKVKAKAPLELDIMVPSNTPSTAMLIGVLAA